MNIGESSNSSYRTACDLLMFYVNNCNYESAFALINEGEVDLEARNYLGMTPLLVILNY
jgi:hypothetical protein